MARLLAVVLVVLGLGLTPQQAVASHPKPSPPDHLLVPMPPVVKFVAGPPPGHPEMSLATDQASLTIYYNEPLDRFGRAHEVGHLLDAEILTDGDRSYFTRLLGLSGPWAQDPATGKAYGSPDEWFADYFAAAAIGMQLDGSTPVDGAYADWGPKRLTRFKHALDRLGRRHHLAPYA